MHIGGCKGVSCDTGRGLLDLTTSWTESEGPREAQRPSTVSKRSPPLVCLLFFMIQDSEFLFVGVAICMPLKIVDNMS